MLNELTGMVLTASPVGDYDRRLVILTKEKGKISAFVRGARKPGSPFVASSQPFIYGKFSLYPGRDAFRVQGIEVQNYFSDLKKDFDAIAYATYFCEFSDSLTRENMDTKEQLRLLYIALRALEKGKMDYSLIRRIFEIRALAIDGEEMQVFSCVNCGKEAEKYVFRVEKGGIVCVDHCFPEANPREILNETTVYTLQFILSTSLEKLFSFQVSEKVQRELNMICNAFIHEYVDRTFKSLDFLDSLT